MFSPGKKFYPSDRALSCNTTIQITLVFGHPVLIFQISKGNSKGKKFLYFLFLFLVVQMCDYANAITERLDDDDDDDDDTTLITITITIRTTAAASVPREP